MRGFWAEVVPKVKAVALLGVTLDGAFLVAWLTGAESWRVALAGAIGATSLPIIGWLKK